MKLLLVEDDQNMSHAVSELLRQEHYIVDVVCEGNEAEDYILSDDYDTVILDVMLPDRNGYEITKAVRRAGNCRNRRTGIVPRDTAFGGSQARRIYTAL